MEKNAQNQLRILINKLINNIFIFDFLLLKFEKNNSNIYVKIK